MSQKKISRFKINYLGNKFITFSILLFLVYFFSNNLIYAQSYDDAKYDYLIPSGKVIQIDAELKNVIVRNSCANSPFIVGDILIKVNGTDTNNYSDFYKILNNLPSDEKIPVLINRSGHNFNVYTTKEMLNKMNFNNVISGFATLTYIDPKTMKFGAVAHPISMGGFKKIPIQNGLISTTTGLNIDKSYRGNVGSLNATKKDVIGQFNQNTNYGIKGTISSYDIVNNKKYKIASLDEVNLGKAQIILQSENDECKKYDIEIVSIENQKNPSAKTFKIRVLDKDLILKTGGIVQGMSGTPIIQDDKIIGAISHAVENDPSLGYGVFIKWMIENNN